MRKLSHRIEPDADCGSTYLALSSKVTSTENSLWTSEVVQQLQVLAARPNDLGHSPRTHVV